MGSSFDGIRSGIEALKNSGMRPSCPGDLRFPIFWIESATSCHVGGGCLGLAEEVVGKGVKE